MLAAADEVDYFESIAARNLRHPPFASRKNLQVELDGEPVGGEAQVFDELRDVQSFWHFTRLAIDLYGQRIAHARAGGFGFSW